MGKILVLLCLVCSGPFLAAKIAADPGLDAVESRILLLTNEERKKEGLPPLQEDAILGKVSREHSEEMARLNYFDHDSPTPGYTQPWDRANRAGVDSDEFAENIYSSQGSRATTVADMAFRAWMNSPEHRANLLSPNYTRVGVGVARQQKRIYVTQMFSAQLDPYP